MRRVRLRGSARRIGVGARWRWSGLIAVALGVSASLANAQSQSATGQITGRITDAASGIPLTSASVRVSGTQIGSQTTEDGRYTIRGVRPGTTEIVVTRIGYEPKRQPVTVTGGGSVTADVTLSQAAFSLS